MSETNLLGNAAVAQQIVAPQQRGPNPLAAYLSMAMEVTGGDRERMTRVLAGVRAYQAHRYARQLEQPAAVARVGAARLLDYGGSGPPVVFVPSLINPPTVLDLAQDNSMLRWLAQQGVRPLLVDWGSPRARETLLSVGGYVTERLLPLIESLGERPAVAGYCLGGTMALAAAAIEPPRKLALIAAPWRFSGYGEEGRGALADYWRGLSPATETLGGLPMEMLQPMFWRLDPEGAVAKFERFGTIDPTSAEAEAFVALEDWANDGPPLSPAVARELFDNFYKDDSPGTGCWLVGGRAIDPASIDCPVINLVSTRDRIVPAAAAPDIGRRVDVDAGHVGMIVGSRARVLVWEPLRDFLLA